MIAHEVATSLALVESAAGYSFYIQNEVSNDELITSLQEKSTGVYSSGDEAELFVFSDGSCINRQGDEYFINDDVEVLAQEYLEKVSF
ncbi:hypothetical protein GCM10011607_28920 [Shewanella inventionis]|uniref:Uncharacterized protein n=1 Tax=Shewanella inventionis TaxID=1738770 RepID=A0ABQ1JGC5_9GAMM|nr:hypothetical protein [Shewanella inventionis]GGB66512.1 hypothetical protein GCM10011607_28920 [Shewanella inventionis]